MKKLLLNILITLVLIVPTVFGLELTGRIVDENMEGNPGRKVLIHKQISPKIIKNLPDIDPLGAWTNQDTWICISDETGNFSSSNLPVGNYILTIISDSLEPLEPEQPYVLHGYLATQIELLSSRHDLIIAPIDITLVDLYVECRIAETDIPAVVKMRMFPDTTSVVGSLSWDKQINLIQEVESDKTGLVIKQNVPSGKYTLFIDTDDSSATLDISIQQGDVQIDEIYKRYLKEAGLDLVFKTRPSQWGGEVPEKELVEEDRLSESQNRTQVEEAPDAESLDSALECINAGIVTFSTLVEKEGPQPKHMNMLAAAYCSKAFLLKSLLDVDESISIYRSVLVEQELSELDRTEGLIGLARSLLCKAYLVPTEQEKLEAMVDKILQRLTGDEKLDPVLRNFAEMVFMTWQELKDQGDPEAIAGGFDWVMQLREQYAYPQF